VYDKNTKIIATFWDIQPCNLVDMSEVLGGTFGLCPQ
jgi:hypothetical protein